MPPVMVFTMLNNLKRDVAIPYRILDHHCINCLLIIQSFLGVAISNKIKELYLETFAMDRQTGQKQSVVTEGKMCLFILVNFPFKWFSCFR